MGACRYASPGRRRPGFAGGRACLCHRGQRAAACDGVPSAIEIVKGPAPAGSGRSTRCGSCSGTAARRGCPAPAGSRRSACSGLGPGIRDCRGCRSVGTSSAADSSLVMSALNASPTSLRASPPRRRLPPRAPRRGYVPSTLVRADDVSVSPYAGIERSASITSRACSASSGVSISAGNSTSVFTPP